MDAHCNGRGEARSSMVDGQGSPNWAEQERSRSGNQEEEVSGVRVPADSVLRMG